MLKSSVSVCFKKVPRRHLQWRVTVDVSFIITVFVVGAATIPTTQSTTTPTPKPVVPGDCSFDTLKNWCGYQSLNTTDFDWQQARGRASSTFFTGPDSDHSGSGMSAIRCRRA